MYGFCWEHQTRWDSPSGGCYECDARKEAAIGAAFEAFANSVETELADMTDAEVRAELEKEGIDVSVAAMRMRELLEPHFKAARGSVS